MNLQNIPTFSAAGLFHVVVESPRGSAVKLKYEPRWDAMGVSRPLTLGVVLSWRAIAAALKLIEETASGGR